jgi:hypothetical protein
VPNLPAAEVIIFLRDATTSVSRVMMYLADSTPITTARAAIQGLLGPLSRLTSCSITGYSVTYTTHLADDRGDGPQRREFRGVFVWSTDQVDEYAVTYLPGIKAALIDPATNEINRTDIAAFISLVQSGPWVNPFGSDIVLLESAFLQIDP